MGSVFFILSVFCSTCLSLSLFYIFVHIVVCISRFSILDCLYSCIKRFCMDFTAISYEVHYINIWNKLLLKWYNSWLWLLNVVDLHCIYIQICFLVLSIKMSSYHIQYSHQRPKLKNIFSWNTVLFHKSVSLFDGVKWYLQFWFYSNINIHYPGY